MKRKGFRMLSLAIIFMLCAGMLSACGGKDGKAENGDSSKRDSIIIATANETPTMAPHQFSSVASTYMHALTHNTLFQTNIDTLAPEPCLVKKYEILNDKEWKLYLRKGVKFHNGEEMTAEDVKASMEYARSFEQYTKNYSSFWESIKIIDDYTLIVKTKEVYAKTLYDLASHYVLPKSLLDSGKDINENPIGTGPYKFVKWTLGDKVEFEAFDDYWEGAPEIKYLTYRVIPEGSSRTIALEAGEIDFIIEVDNNDLGRLESNENIKVINKESTHIHFMVLNREKYPFDNQEFRHALNCAVDKDALVEVALNGAGTGLHTMTPYVFEGAATKIPDKYDLDLAREHLEKSGIDPKTVKFSCVCSDDVKRRCGEVIQANLAELGITMTLESMDLATYLSAAGDGTLEACIGGYPTTNMMKFIEGVYHSSSINGTNWTRTNEPKIDKLYAEAIHTLEADKRNKILEECANYINEVCPLVPTYMSNITRAYNADLEGVEVAANNTLRWQYVTWAD